MTSTRQTDKPVSTIKLDARLLAKLLTWSYYDDHNAKGDPAVAGNPANISVDPEFQALNPGLYVVQPDFGNRVAASLLTLSTQSDVVYAMTSYINADPEARAWLNGTPDPWGMTVNSNYKGIQLPVNIWPLLDSYIPYFPDQTGRNVLSLHCDPSLVLALHARPRSATGRRSGNPAHSNHLEHVGPSAELAFPMQFVRAQYVGIDPAQGLARIHGGYVTEADAARYGLPLRNWRPSRLRARRRNSPMHRAYVRRADGRGHAGGRGHR